ncbi:MAG: transglutaminase-like domain-containing protein [Methanoregula sp.]|nr:transglutaminase-like domain-containing protein [Methanoregula sp.]
MGRKGRKYRNKSTKALLEYYDDAFIVSEEESYTINDQEYLLRDSLHVVKDGNEFLFIDNEPYLINKTPSSAPHKKTSTIGTVFKLLVGIFVGALIAAIIISSLFGSNVIGNMASDVQSKLSTLHTTSATLPTTPIVKSGSIEQQRAEKIKEAMDFTNPVTRDFALTFIPKSHSGEYNIAQICDLWETIYKKWTYVNDPRGRDYYSPASRTIQLGLKGDCDDFAITVASVIQSIGGSSRVVTAYNAEGGHAYPEVFIGTRKTSLDAAAEYISKRYHVKSIAYHTHTKDGVTQYWLNLDWQSQHPGGKFFHDSGELTFYYPNGYWYQSN